VNRQTDAGVRDAQLDDLTEGDLVSVKVAHGSGKSSGKTEAAVVTIQEACVYANCHIPNCGGKSESCTNPKCVCDK
jgi:hypothetical protein